MEHTASKSYNNQKSCKFREDQSSTTCDTNKSRNKTEQLKKSGKGFAMFSSASALFATERDQRHEWFYNSEPANHNCSYRNFFKIFHPQLGLKQANTCKSL